LLNIYDLNPANDYLWPVGLGFHHSGVEINGTEYSFGSGSGIFEGPPKHAPGATFRQEIDLGAYDGGQPELLAALDDMRSSGSFGPNDYNLIRKNCNHFANGLVWRLLRRTIPPYVNRWADLAMCCSCLLPKKMLGEAPVGGGTGGGSPSSSFLTPTKASMQRGSGSISAFSGKGQSLGGGLSSTASTSGSSTSDGGGGLLSGWTKSTHTCQAPEDLTDRRERARKAALARLERDHQKGTSSSVS
jgi:deubiquitinase DESI2